MRLSKIVVAERRTFVTEQVLQNPTLKIKDVQELLAAKFGHKMHPTELMKVVRAARGTPTVTIAVPDGFALAPQTVADVTAGVIPEVVPGPFTPPTAPAEPSVAVFDAPVEPQTGGVVEVDDTGCDVN